MADNAPSTPAPAATSAAATPVAAPQPAPASAAVTAPSTPAAEPAPAAAASSPAQPATAPAPATPVESLIGGPEKAPEVAPAAEPAKAPEPGTYDLKLPEGVEVDAPLMDSAKAIFTEGKVSPETAQKLVTLQAEGIKQIAEKMRDAQLEAWNTTIRGWQKEITEDKTLGGQNWVTTKRAIEGGLQTIFGITQATPANDPARGAHKAFVDALAMTGAGSNPAIIRGLHKMVATRSEGRPAPVGGPSAPKKSAADTMYGNKAAAE